jgi:EAL domain-containing protein (putative c-di-GMP-specific phosphodiesterase class I)
MQSLRGTKESSGDKARQLRRMRRVLQIWATGMVLGGSFFGINLALRGDWFMTAVEAQLVLTAVLAFWLARHDRPRYAALAMMVSLFFTLCVVCGTQDLATAKVPRTSHIFFLAMGMATFLMFKGEGWWLRHGLTLISFSAFVYFASSSTGWPQGEPVPDTLRGPWAWGINVFGLVVLYALLVVMQSNLVEQHSLSVDLRNALANRQFVLHFQPQVGAQGQIVGAEALLRWQLPEHGMISPAEFIPLAEQSGLILPLGQWVLDTACRTLVTWAGAPHTADLTLAVNVSAQQLAHPNYVDQVIKTLRATGANPERLKLELTESTLVQDVEDTVVKMTALKAIGVQFAMDDFGTGYSSLNYLKRLPLDQLKIDQSFVRDVLTDPNDAAIARTVVALGQTLGLEVMAEGVETLRQQQFLSEIGCHCFQGYLISRPLPAPEFDAFLTAYSAG